MARDFQIGILLRILKLQVPNLSCAYWLSQTLAASPGKRGPESGLRILSLS